MKILGLHFGHDAAATVVDNGQVLSYIMKERHNRIKHAMTLNMETIEAALQDAEVKFSDIDYVAISSTQRKELIIDNPERLQIQYKDHDTHEPECVVQEYFREKNINLSERLSGDLLNYLYDESFRDTPAYRAYSHFFPEHKQFTRDQFKPVGCLDEFVLPDEWETPIPFEEMAEINPAKFLDGDYYSNAFHYPMTVELDGCSKPGYFIHHHMCHAANTFYMSGYKDAAIITHDGHSRPRNYNAGMFYYGKGNKIYPVWSHYMFLGALYDSVGLNLKLGIIGPAGKLMGLAPWGQPRMLDNKFIGNWGDFCKTIDPSGDYRSAWWQHCLDKAKELDYDLTALSDGARITEPVNADIAASTQMLFEEILLKASRTLYSMLGNAGVKTENICLSGGTALNCPANARLWRETEYSNTYIEPCCDDGGIAIGAALAVYHNVLDTPREEPDANKWFSPYIGKHRDHSEVEQALEKYSGQVSILQTEGSENKAAELLQDNSVLAWYEGRSEAGPRALGHRTLVADVRPKENWERVNRIKGRELWRPFAPVVLLEHAEEWFEGCPVPSPYMLFTAQVTKPDEIPAITHVDGSSRIQTVTPETGRFHKMMEHFYKLTNVPVLMNTSFNGPAEPIVETPEQALNLLLTTDIDALWLDGHLVVKK